MTTPPTPPPAGLFESHCLIGGRPGQGKSAAVLALLLGAALDPTQTGDAAMAVDHWETYTPGGEDRG